MIKQSHNSISIVITALIVLIFSQCNSIKRSFDSPPSPNSINDDEKCYDNGKLTTSQRLQIFPFNQAESIRVVSFNSNLGKAPIENDTIVHSQTIENILLTTSQIEGLTNILFNYNYSDKTTSFNESQVGCYFPRHAIIFLNKSEKVISFIEICLECKKTVTTLPPENVGKFCDGKYELIYNFFQSIGIEHYKDE